MNELNVNRIYCLSLKKDIHRRAQMMEHFPLTGHMIQFVLGIDGSIEPLNNPAWIKDIRPHKNYTESIRKHISVLNYTISTKEKACVLGHMKIWKMIADLNDPTPCLIMEDDIFPIDELNFIRSTNKIVKEVNENEIIYLGYRSFKSPPKPIYYIYVQRIWHWFKHKRFTGSLNSIVNFNLIFKQTPRKSKTKQNLNVAGQHWGAFCYLVTPLAAREILALNAHVKMTSDGTLRYANLTNSIPMFVSKTSLVQVNEDLGSNIRSPEEHRANFRQMGY